jgi:hypothetical protein
MVPTQIAEYERKLTTVTFIIIVVLLITMALAATRWSFDSREKINSPEWERRAYWRGRTLLYRPHAYVHPK